MEENKNKYCNNCYTPINSNAKFCSSCGQKKTDGRISISEFFSVFFSTVFNLESKFFQSMRDIFIPGKLTTEWFKGKHKRYFHPVRLFIVSALLLIAVLSTMLSDDFMRVPAAQKNALKGTHRKTFIKEIEAYSKQYSDNTPEKNILDSLSQKMARGTIKKNDLDDFLRDMAKDNDLINADSMSSKELKDYYTNLLGANTIEEIQKGVTVNNRLGIDSISLRNLLMFNLGNEKYQLRNIANEDFINLSLEEVADKYEVEGYFERLLFKKKLKLLKEGKNFGPYLLGNSVWVILLMMPFLALILRFLYFRRDYFYVEHLVFSFHTHAFVFIIFAITAPISFYYNAPWLAASTPLILFFYLYKSMRNVYGQGKWKTFIKLLLVNFFYLFLSSFFILAGLFIGMALF